MSSHKIMPPELAAGFGFLVISPINPASDYSREQGYIKMPIFVQNKADQMIYTYNFHIELRWCHGKFCGNPEAKLYKDFDWSSVRFFEKIVTYIVNLIHGAKIKQTKRVFQSYKFIAPASIFVSSRRMVPQTFPIGTLV